MTLRARVLVQVTCSECQEHYDVALGLQTVFAMMQGDLQDAPLPAPAGWLADTSRAFCPAHVPPGPGILEPTPAVLHRAASLQALAQNEAATENERSNAWAQFEKLWRRYKLPKDLGLK